MCGIEGARPAKPPCPMCLAGQFVETFMDSTGVGQIVSYLPLWHGPLHLPFSMLAVAQGDGQTRREQLYMTMMCLTIRPQPKTCFLVDCGRTPVKRVSLMLRKTWIKGMMRLTRRMTDLSL